MEEAIGALKEGHGRTAKQNEEIKNNLVSLSFPEASAAGSQEIKKMEEAIGALKKGHGRTAKQNEEIKNNLVSLGIWASHRLNSKFPVFVQELSGGICCGSQEIKKMEEAIGALKEGHGRTAKENEEIKNNLVSLSFPEASAAGSQEIKKMEEAIRALKEGHGRTAKENEEIKNNLVSVGIRASHRLNSKFPVFVQELSGGICCGSQEIKKMEEAIGALKEGHGRTAKENEEIENNLVSLGIWASHRLNSKFPVFVQELSGGICCGSPEIKKMEEAIGALKEGHGRTAKENEEIKNNLVSLSFPEASAAGSQEIKKMEEAIGALKEGHGRTAKENEEIKNNLVSLSFPEASAAGSQEIKKMEEAIEALKEGHGRTAKENEEIKNNLVSLEHRYILEGNDAEGDEVAPARVTPTPLAFPVSTDYHMVVLACIAAMVALISLRAELYELHYGTMLITVDALGAYGLGATFMLKLQQLGFKPGILNALISRLILSVGVITIACLGSMLLPDDDIVWCIYVAIAFLVCSMMVTWDILWVMYDPL